MNTYKNEIINNSIIEAKSIIDRMIFKSKEQNLLGFEFLYNVKDLLEELEIVISSKKEINSKFMENWNLMIGNTFRALEGTKLEILLNLIEKEFKQIS